MRRLFVLLLLPSVAGLAGAAAVRAEIVERIIAKVNGEIITLTDFQERQITAAQTARVGRNDIGRFLRENNARLLQEAIDEILLVQKAEDAGLALNPEFIDDVIESIKKDNKIESEEQFQAALAQEGMTLDDLRASIRRSMTQRMIINRDIEPKIQVSDEAVREEYEKRKDEEFTRPATMTLKEIFIPEDAGGLRLARELVERARAGEDFASLARTHSKAPTAESGGDLGEISQGEMSPELEAVVLPLPVGSVTDPIPVADGYRILRVVAKTSGSVVPFETARDRLLNQLRAARFKEEYDTYIAGLREKADIELRVREVPLRLSGPVPTDTLLEGVDPFSLMGPGSGAPGAAAAGPAPSRGRSGDEAADDEFSTTPQSRPERIVPGSITEDEIATTPQAAPERVAPAGAEESEDSGTP
jgi:peptidyl-prolyl cis-trans isomerase SurA